VWQRRKAAQRARRRLKQNHHAVVSSRRDVARCQRPVEQLDCGRPPLWVPIGVDCRADPGIRSMQGAQQRPQVVRRVYIVVLMKLLVSG
jgi:hypothetical protein